MARHARWIRLGPVESLELRATYTGLAAAQPADAAPILLWARALPVAPGPPGGAPARVDGNAYVFVLIAPRRHAPGRPARWIAWALAPAIATYRQFGLPAYQDGNDLWLDGRKIAGSAAAAIGECAVVASSFLPRFPLARAADRMARSSPEFRAWLRAGTTLAMSEWAAQGELPAERALEEAFRARLEAQYGWRFEHGWPSAQEAASIGAARLEPLGGREPPFVERDDDRPGRYCVPRSMPSRS